ncbi:FAD-binding and (Fe-S)-binding domain-containing protein [Vibrio sp. La 4.2.2]|uniref:D-2-hydroxyglutarate dehydrogenase YdiJ n=1 Tax=unclassified Vibrio TaxID=2614977 RepID=UPI001F2CF3E9|nr:MULTISPECIES: FAD-binding and (Fe-S)-binding domain-containing protein [unclassified Vibrio]MCF4173306.1 FAD-binding oxidoreductase [Vibrio sp. McD22-P3]MDA0109979.1 FAD-binding and (Fe-S)-binding domain-containing protein [Vibrio sp. La 4.2.2]
MLPRLHSQTDINPTVLVYLKQLEAEGFTGDIETQYSSRLAVATDNSVYQKLPQAVVHPKTTADVQLIGKLANQEKFAAIAFSPRGGGTGTNGQSLTSGIVVDLSRHMNQVLEINEQEGWVRVQTGIVKDALNDAVRPYGFFFSPDLSTSNRATLGGMVNTDASGQGSLKYGKTSDHVLSLQAVFADGSLLESDGSLNQLEQDSFAANALQIAEQVCKQNRVLIDEKFPPLNRFLTGYDLKNAYDPKTESFNATRILCGAEGSLAFITEAKLNLTPIPKARTLINVKYNSFDAALRNAPFMVEANALSVETVDSRVLNLAKQDIVWHTVSDLISDVPGKEMQGINMVEYAGQDEEEVTQAVAALTKSLDEKLKTEQDGIIGYQVTSDVASLGRIYNMRKKAVGLLGAVKGSAKPIAFAEDTCVPPENLADFIAEFRDLLDGHGLNYGMFGHVDAGVLHVRPALDMCDPEQESLMHQISDEVVKLVAKYGGLMWGEHGKGFRSEYGPDFFGEQLFNELRRIKAACDPLNKMNPGKICTPLESTDELVKVSDTKRGTYDRQIPIEVRDSFAQAMECNGNGLCFNYDTASPMCPSMKVTADRRHSPKGRAGLVREWLRQLSEQGFDVLELETNINRSNSAKGLIEKWRNTFNKRHEYDFSHEVYDAMNGCLACKACASQCPIKVDVPSFRARFLNLYYSRYQRPAKDYLVANIETLLPYMAKFPKVVNFGLNQRVVQTLTEKTVGYIDAPLLSVPTLKQRLKSQPVAQFSLEQLQAIPAGQRSDYVCIVQDPFTSFYDAEVVEDFAKLILKMGKKPVLLPFKPNGKAAHIKGFLSQFAKGAKSTADFLTQVSQLNIPLVGVDPALVLCYRDEYVEILKEERGTFNVLTAHEWLMPLVQDKDALEMVDEADWYLFAHCTEKTKMPNAEKEWGAIFHHFGGRLTTVPVGCCGMAGTFGHESDKLQMSKDIYGLSWQPNLDKLPKERCLVTGYSCRSQVKRFEDVKVKHPVQALLQLLN